MTATETTTTSLSGTMLDGLGICPDAIHAVSISLTRLHYITAQSGFHIAQARLLDAMTDPTVELSVDRNGRVAHTFACGIVYTWSRAEGWRAHTVKDNKAILAAGMS